MICGTKNAAQPKPSGWPDQRYVNLKNRSMESCPGGIGYVIFPIDEFSLFVGHTVHIRPGRRETRMKRFMLLHYGFEKPTPEIMAEWTKWFESVADKAVEHGGPMSGREISKGGTEDLPMGMDSIAGYSIISAETLGDAEEIARGNPFIASIRVYEIRPH
jgi:hypothetical protein